jgi:hypothetical protein
MASTVKSPKTKRELLTELYAIPMREIINEKWLRREMGKLSRQQLKANGFNTKGLTGQQCTWLANQHMRAFLGMDRPNIFTGTVSQQKRKK